MGFVTKEDLTAIFTNLNTKLKKKPTAIRLTQAEYDALTTEEKHDTSKTYYVTDMNPSGSGYTLPVASDTVLGGVKVGSGLSIDNNGVLSALDKNLELIESITIVHKQIKRESSMIGEYYAPQVYEGYFNTPWSDIETNYKYLLLNITYGNGENVDVIAPLTNYFICIDDINNRQVSDTVIYKYVLNNEYYFRQSPQYAAVASYGYYITPCYNYVGGFNLLAYIKYSSEIENENKLYYTFSFTQLVYSTDYTFVNKSSTNIFPQVAYKYFQDERPITVKYSLYGIRR